MAESRDIFLFDQIDQSTARTFYQTIIKIDKEDEKLKQEDKETVYIHLNSYGGQVDSMWTIINAMQHTSTPIETICAGIICSAAFTIFLFGDNRVAYPNTTMLYHQVSAGTRGKVGTMMEEIEHIKRMEQDNEKAILQKTKIIKKELEAWNKQKLDKIFYPEDYFKYGLVDEIIDLETGKRMKEGDM